VVAALPGPFEVVLSAGLLSQIMHGCRVAMGESHLHLEFVAKALVTGHLRAMARLLRPGGAGLLVTDTASSKTVPLAERWGKEPPLALLERLQQEDELLSGTTPGLLLRILTEDPVVTPLLAAPPQLIQPWLWTLGNLTMMVYALVFKRRA
jgi:hypothetical protein